MNYAPEPTAVGLGPSTAQSCRSIAAPATPSKTGQAARQLARCNLAASIPHSHRWLFSSNSFASIAAAADHLLNLNITEYTKGYIVAAADEREHKASVLKSDA